jgi:hypothetical protein
LRYLKQGYWPPFQRYVLPPLGRWIKVLRVP